MQMSLMAEEKSQSRFIHRLDGRAKQPKQHTIDCGYSQVKWVTRDAPQHRTWPSCAAGVSALLMLVLFWAFKHRTKRPIKWKLIKRL